MITIMGISGNGKTYLSKALIKVWPYDRIFIFDPADEYSDIIPGEVLDSVEVVEAFQSGRKAVRLTTASPEDMEALFIYLKELDNILFIFNEGDLVLANQHNPEGFDWIVNIGRHARQGLIVIARRPQDLPRNFTAQSILIFSNTVEPRDVDYIKSRIGKLPERVPKYGWYAHDPETGELTYFKPSWAYTVLKGA